MVHHVVGHDLSTPYVEPNFDDLGVGFCAASAGFIAIASGRLFLEHRDVDAAAFHGARQFLAFLCSPTFDVDLAFSGSVS